MTARIRIPQKENCLRIFSYLLLTILLIAGPSSGHTEDFSTSLKAASAAFAKRDYETAFKLALPAAEAGNARAQGFVGSLYSYGRGVPQNYELAVKWFRKSANQGFPASQIAMGDFYLMGIVVEKDEKNAFTWIKKAADQNEGLALFRVAQMYRAGVGVEKDVDKANEYEALANQQAEDILGNWPTAKKGNP